jgi:predicted tellurium resistance membrane protein TerC
VISIAFVLVIPGLALAHGAEEGFSLLDQLPSLTYLLAVILSVLAIVVGIKSAIHLDSKRQESLMYLVSGTIAIGLITIVELIFNGLHLSHLPDESMVYVKNILTYIALVLFAVGFYKIKEDEK